MNKTGKVFIVGAGPGDPFLITLKGFKALQKADVVLYDRLVHPYLLTFCKKDCQKIYVGKQARKHTFKQEEINRMLINFAVEGKNVVRLKGGDPYIFGRGSEESLALAESGIEFEVIPGISSALGASAFAGIPLTHRNLVTQSIFVTAHEDPTKTQTQIDWSQLAKIPNSSLVIFMGSNLLKEISMELVSNGMHPSTPVAIVQNATLPYQNKVVTTLEQLHLSAEILNLGSPLLAIISPTASFSNQLDWFKKLPLKGKKLIITRSANQSKSLFENLIELGAEPILFPTIETSFVDSGGIILDTFTNNNPDWIIFTSENGVRFFFQNIFKMKKDTRILGNSKVAAIGKSTARTLEEFSIFADFVPTIFDSSNFLEEFQSKFEISNSTIVRVKGNFKTDLISDVLKEKCKHLIPIEVYKIIKPQHDETLISEIKDSSPDAIVFTSSSTVENFVSIIGEKLSKKLLSNSKVIAIGKTTAKKLQEFEITNYYVAKEFTIDGIIDKVLEIFKKGEQ